MSSRCRSGARRWCSARRSSRSRRRSGRRGRAGTRSARSSTCSAATRASTWSATTTASRSRRGSCTRGRWSSSAASMRAPPPASTSAPDHRAGFAALIGRPNAGKSTLLNRLLGQKLAIVSPKPQTTRNRIRGVRTRSDAQVIYVDTPGLHAPRGSLGEFMAATVAQAVQEVDLVVVVADATAAGDPAADAVLWAALDPVTVPAVLALNKVDLVPARPRLLPLLEAYAARYPFRTLIPISAADGTGVDRLEESVVALLPPGPPPPPPDTVTDQPETFFVAEMIREQLFRVLRQE